jgi:transposase, IS5 family
VTLAIAHQIGASVTQVIADAGYRSYNAPHINGLRVYTSGQKRRVTELIRWKLRQRAMVGR